LGVNKYAEQTIDLLFYSHCQTADDDKTPFPISLSFSPQNNRGLSPNKSQTSHKNRSDDGMNPKSSVVAAKPDTRSTRTNSMKKTEMVQRSGPADMGKLVSDHHCFSVISTNPASSAIQASPPNSMLFPGKQSSYPYANLNHRAFWPSQ